MFYATHLIGFGAGEAAQASLTFTNDPRIANSGGGTNSFTFTTVDFGAGGRVVVAVGANTQGSDFTTVTIGGVSATKVSQADFESGGNYTRVAVYEASGVGTSGSVVVNFGASNALSCGIGPFVLTDAAASIGTPRSATGDPATLGTGLAVPARGTALAVVHNNVNSTYTWTGLTERADTGDGSGSFSCASDDFETAQAALSISAESAGAPTRQAMLAVSWGPSA